MPLIFQKKKKAKRALGEKGVKKDGAQEVKEGGWKKKRRRRWRGMVSFVSSGNELTWATSRIVVKKSET